MKTEEALKKIRTYNNQILKTKELILMGLTNYNIKQLESNKDLIKVEKGKYKVSFKSKNQDRKFFIHNVMACIHLGELEKAIHNFNIYIKRKKEHQLDKIYNIIYLLLKELTADEALLNELEEIKSQLVYNKDGQSLCSALANEIINQKYYSALKIIDFLKKDNKNLPPIFNDIEYLLKKVLKKYTQNLNEKKIYEFIKDKKYDLAYDTITLSLQQEPNNKAYLNIIKMLHQMEEIKNNSFVSEKHTTCSKILSEFFIALKNKDYRYANKLIDKIKRKNDPEFAIYKLLLDDINALLDEKEQNPNYYKSAKLQNEINSIFKNEEILTIEIIGILKDLYKTKLNIEANIIDETCLNIIETIVLVHNEGLTKEYFDTQNEREYNKFFMSLQYGDYLSSIAIVEQYKNLCLLTSEISKKQIYNLKKLLLTLKEELNNNEFKSKTKIDINLLSNLIIRDKYEKDLERKRVIE